MLSGNRHAQDRPNAVTISNLARRAARPVQPFRKIADLNFVFDSNICDRHVDDIGTLGDASDPFVPSNRSEPLGHSLAFSIMLRP